MKFLKQSHSAEKLEKGDPFDFLKLRFAAKFQKTWRGIFWRQKKFEKKPHSAEKNWKSRTVPKEIARKSFWLKQGLEPVTAGFTVNRVLTSACEREWSL